jgi:hypothetical protein
MRAGYRDMEKGIERTLGRPGLHVWIHGGESWPVAPLSHTNNGMMESHQSTQDSRVSTK